MAGDRPRALATIVRSSKHGGQFKCNLNLVSWPRLGRVATVRDEATSTSSLLVAQSANLSFGSSAGPVHSPRRRGPGCPGQASDSSRCASLSQHTRRAKPSSGAAGATTASGRWAVRAAESGPGPAGARRARGPGPLTPAWLERRRVGLRNNEQRGNCPIYLPVNLRLGSEGHTAPKQMGSGRFSMFDST